MSGTTSHAAKAQSRTAPRVSVEVPVWEKYTLSIEEAAEYFHVGQARLRQLVMQNPDADFILSIGNRILIKRKLFEQYIDAVAMI